MIHKYHPHYSRWRNMLTRCRNRHFKQWLNYGGRGITVCKAWLIFENFARWCDKTYIPGRTLDRKNNDGPYSPKNCRWATWIEQQENSRETPLRKRARKKNGLLAKKRFSEFYGVPGKRRLKYCPKCKIFQSTKNFHRVKTKVDGLYNYCKACAKERDRIRRQNVK